MHRRLPSLLLLTTALAGCDLAPHYDRPALAAPSRFPQGPAYPAATGGQDATQDVAGIGWRDFFTDDRLRQTIALGLANNRDLRVAAANILAARAQYRAQRADLFPTIAAGADASVRHSGSNGSNGSSVSSGSTGTSGSTEGSGTAHSYTADIGVSSFELDLFGKVRNETKAAQQAYFATQAGADATRISLIAEIATAWLTMGSDQDQLRLSTQTLRAYQQSVDITRAQFDKGIASELDVRQAETNLQNARYDVAQLTTQIAQDQNALNLLAGTTVSAALLPDGIGADDHTLAALPAGLDSTILLKRPDVVQAEDQLRAQYANIGAARAAFFPTISLTSAAGTASSALTGLFSGGSFSWNATGSSALTLFDFGRNKANLRYAEANRDAAVAAYEKAVQTAFREVSDALATRGTIGAQIAARTAGAGSADKAATLSLARYRSGIDSFLTTLDAQRTLYAAQQSLVTTRLQRETNLVTLYSTLGGGLR
ncbi:efflux transporter outer membrane subunit [Sphingomonas abietis]|uniref:Efflux transporter outer membrane subunit n=1 Tax=Sphingomonas abietis TaxID=3012344 RepID=A0ABY7NRU9_9SPHN|nr:efflux transporter outer membrane subunit [Sphingomonas abietis]WBO23176.1 efflux transporter outer membrane subunit [Sphingomonas abietis]